MSKNKPASVIIADQAARILELLQDVERLTADKEGLTLALRAAETKIENMQKHIDRMYGWQDCAREILRRHLPPDLPVDGSSGLSRLMEWSKS